MEEIHKLRAQISNIVQVNFPGVDSGFVSNLRPPSALQVRQCCSILHEGNNIFSCSSKS
jgi:ATP-dependent RNA helicase DHX37/DHR1